MKRRAVVYRRILILCEGFTEEIYAKSLRSAFLSRAMQRSVTVEVVRHKKNDPLNLIAEAKKRVKQANKEKAPYEDVWLFFDHDHSPHLTEVFSISKEEGYRLAFTAISLEFWFILHFEDCGRAFKDGEECLRYLKKLWPSYHKTKLNHFVELGSYLETALIRAAQLQKKYEDDNIKSEFNPFTSVHKLVAYFKELEK
ncbi:RloB family protein [Sphingobacterium paucimobilis]|uniref:RloB-like protein n=1 Tax=Sphingobacterium paucimobilis HER1398 TaxID=1346330 RepID=U2HPF3_9SPHI|nr:RloB family protein [Sphingobacterium paucimobilis]ERJ57352.1 hypothetical protein M472_01095 [Sphingobacterium paucimobilis HER1398]